MLRTALLVFCGTLLPVAATTPTPEAGPSEPVPAATAPVQADRPAPVQAGTALTIQADHLALVRAATTLKVTVRYTGSGQVSEERKIWIWLFDREPDPSAPVPPVAQQSLAVNGGVADFTGLTPSRVWVAVMYDERGGFAADGPPPSGSPAGTHSVDGQMAPVTPAPNASIEITFNDQFRIP